MRLYEGTVQQFRKEVLGNNIADLIADKYKEYYHRKVNSSEFNSWNVSLRFLKDVLESSEFLKNRIIVEYELPYSEKRIDRSSVVNNLRRGDIKLAKAME